MKTDVNGCSTCTKGKESFEYFISPSGKAHVQYDYRTPQGELFSTIAPDLKTCRAQRDAWVAEKPETRS